MHTMEFVGGWVVNHNGDFSGDVELRAPGHPTGVTKVPFMVLQAVVAEKIRLERIAALEQASDAELTR